MSSSTKIVESAIEYSRLNLVFEPALYTRLEHETHYTGHWFVVHLILHVICYSIDLHVLRSIELNVQLVPMNTRIKGKTLLDLIALYRKPINHCGPSSLGFYYSLSVGTESKFISQIPMPKLSHFFCSHLGNVPHVKLYIWQPFLSEKCLMVKHFWRCALNLNVQQKK